MRRRLPFVRFKIVLSLHAHRLIRTVARGEPRHRTVRTDHEVVRLHEFLASLIAVVAARHVIIVLLRGGQPHRSLEPQTTVFGHDFLYFRYALYRITHLMQTCDVIYIYY